MLDKLERRFGRFAVPNITLLLIAGQVCMYVAAQMDPQIAERLAFVPQKVLDGEVYRIAAFVFMPPLTHILWAFLAWYVFHFLGTMMEMFWGTFRYNVFLLVGYIATVAAAFLTPQQPASNYFLYETVFLAFAYINPRFEFRLFFLIPVQVRWLALIDWLFFAWRLYAGSWIIKCQVLAIILNFLLFFGRDIWSRLRYGRRSVLARAKRFAAQRAEPDYFHICAVCGITDKSDPDEDFRYCSQCSGSLAYCSTHLKDHEHVTDIDDTSL